jgi:hypothetical protein
MKRCDKKQLTLWIAGGLSPDEEAACRAHLSGCARCREDHAALTKVFDAFETHASALPQVDGVGALHDALQQRLEGDSGTEYPSRYSYNFRSWLIRLALPAAAVILLLFWLDNERKKLISSQPSIVQTQSLPAKAPSRPVDPTFSNYSNASRHSLEDFDRLLDGQLRAPASQTARSVDTSVSLQTML